MREHPISDPVQRFAAIHRGQATDDVGTQQVLHHAGDGVLPLGADALGQLGLRRRLTATD